MGFYQSFRLAIDSIMKSKVRAFLTMLGIIIGVAAVTVIVGMGTGMKNYISNSFESMGTNLINVNIRGRGSSRTVNVADMYTLVEDNPTILAYVSPLVSISNNSTSSIVQIGSEKSGTTTVTGVGEDYASIKRYTVSTGRFLQYVDVSKREKVCVIGSYLAATYYNDNAIGQTIKISGNTFTIVGVLTATAESAVSTADDAIYIPYTNAQIMSWTGKITSYAFSGASENTITSAVTLIQNALYKVYENSDYYTVTSMTSILSTMTSMVNVVVMVLGAIAAISLVVGGIGIMNIMLVSVTERTREIGIRKSLGAKQKDILQQFVIEAATTSALGGIIGIGVGYLLSSVATKIITSLMSENITVAPSITAVLAAFSVSVAIGIIFGYLPAKKAAQLNPIDALRYD